MSKNILEELAEAVGGKIESVSGPLPDGSGFATMSFPLPKDHWLTKPGYNDPPMPFRLGTQEDGATLLPPIRKREELAEMVRAAARYACRASTMNGKETDFDPDAMVQNFVVGMLGYWTPNGLSRLDGSDEAPRLPADWMTETQVAPRNDDGGQGIDASEPRSHEP